MPDARSIIMVAMNYYTDTDEGPGMPPHEPDRAIFARYARGDDYHDVMIARLKELEIYLKLLAPEGTNSKVYVDTGPLLEREVAQRGLPGPAEQHLRRVRGAAFGIEAPKRCRNALLKHARLIG